MTIIVRTLLALATLFFLVLASLSNSTNYDKLNNLLLWAIVFLLAELNLKGGKP